MEGKRMRRFLGTKGRFAFLFCLSALLAVTVLPGKGNKFKVSGFVGESSMTAAAKVEVALIEKKSGDVVDVDETNFFGKYTFKNVVPGAYLLRVRKITRAIVVKNKNLRIDIDLSAEGGNMDYAKSAELTRSTDKGSSSGTQSKGTSSTQSAGPSDPSMMKWMAGDYYSYAGSTERKVMFCPGGAFFDSSESSYSGTSSDSLGNQTQAWGTAGQRSGSGSWAIQGNQNEGVITLAYRGGKLVKVRYRATGERGCFTFDGTTFCYNGPPRCQ
jgi:hypothetical protein